MFHANVTGLDPNDPAKAAAVMEANSRAVKHSNDAVAAMKRGRYEEAAALHQQALALKLPAFGSNSVQAAISYNGLGECLLKAGRVADAEVNIAKALHVRDAKSSGGLGMGPPMDSAVTRDNMAQVYEAQGKWDEAKEMRLRGSEKGEMVCGNYEVSVRL
jgi:tetratricopeptide (TPR) repeat protein